MGAAIAREYQADDTGPRGRLEDDLLDRGDVGDERRRS